MKYSAVTENIYNFAEAKDVFKSNNHEKDCIDDNDRIFGYSIVGTDLEEL